MTRKRESRSASPFGRGRCWECDRSESRHSSKKKRPPPFRRGPPEQDLDVGIEHELPRVRPQGDLVDLALALVVDPGVDYVLREHAALEQELVVLLERVQRLG